MAFLYWHSRHLLKIKKRKVIEVHNNVLVSSLELPLSSSSSLLQDILNGISLVCINVHFTVRLHDINNN